MSSVTIHIQIPMQSVISFQEFGNLKVGSIEKDVTIKYITLISSYKNPGYATLQVTGIDSKNCTIKKIFELKYTIDSNDLNTGIATLIFNKYFEPKQEWYVFNSNLVKTILKTN